MKAIFETFTPKNPILVHYVNYYYVDIKPDNVRTEFTCFPHYNNVFSLYRSHEKTPEGMMVKVLRNWRTNIILAIRRI